MRREVDHRLAAVAGFAVDVLEQMERQAARAVEQPDIALLRGQQVADGKPRRHAFDRLEAVPGQKRVFPRRGGDLARRPGEFGGGILQQRRQRPVGLHRAAPAPFERPPALGPTRTSWLNRSSLPVPPLHPSPKLKPHSPRRSNASSAYSRWVVGITNRSS